MCPHSTFAKHDNEGKRSVSVTFWPMKIWTHPPNPTWTSKLRGHPTEKPQGRSPRMLSFPNHRKFPCSFLHFCAKDWERLKSYFDFKAMFPTRDPVFSSPQNVTVHLNPGDLLVGFPICFVFQPASQAALPKSLYTWPRRFLYSPHPSL